LQLKGKKLLRFFKKDRGDLWNTERWTANKKAPCGASVFCREEGIRTPHFFHFLKTLETLVSIGFQRF
jgi:hypothetical protein